MLLKYNNSISSHSGETYLDGIKTPIFEFYLSRLIYFPYYEATKECEKI